MSRTPARFLAPLALIAAVVAIWVVVSGSTGASSDGGDGKTGSTTTGQTTRTGSTTKTTTAGATKRRTFAVRAGDNLSTVAEATGLSIDELRQLNPDVDPNALRVGQKLKLTPGGG